MALGPLLPPRSLINALERGGQWQLAEKLFLSMCTVQVRCWRLGTPVLPGFGAGTTPRSASMWFSPFWMLAFQWPVCLTAFISPAGRGPGLLLPPEPAGRRGAQPRRQQAAARPDLPLLGAGRAAVAARPLRGPAPGARLGHESELVARGEPAAGMPSNCAALDARMASWPAHTLLMAHGLLAPCLPPRASRR